MSLPTSALTTVAAVREIVGDAMGTGRIERSIQAVSTAMARYAGITWEYAASIVEFHKGNGLCELYLGRRAVTSLTSVYIDSEAQTLATLDSGSLTPADINTSTVYRTTSGDELGVLLRYGGWPIASGVWGDLTGQPNISPEARGTNIRVVYAGGYVTPNGVGTRNLPYDLEEACIREVASHLMRPVGGLVSERTPGGWSQTWGTSNRQGARDESGSFSADTMAILDTYRRQWF